MGMMLPGYPERGKAGPRVRHFPRDCRGGATAVRWPTSWAPLILKPAERRPVSGAMAGLELFRW